jgi:thiamine-monophosphate kinase
MNEAASEVTVFLSYAGPERDQALRVRDALNQRGVRIVMDSNFESGESILVNIGNAINSGVVLGLISKEYLDRRYTEIEASAAMASPAGIFIPVIIGDVPEPATQRGKNLWAVLRARSMFRLEMDDESLDRLVREIRRIDRLDRPLTTLAPDSDDTGQLSIALIYDWEDGHLVDEAAKQCAAAGMNVVYLSGAGVAIEAGKISPDACIGILWTQAAEASPELASAILNAVAAGYVIIYLLQPDGPAPPTGARVFQINRINATYSHVRATRPTVRWVRDHPLLRARVDESIRLNEGIPFNLLGDKFCVGRHSAAMAEEVYQMAVHQFRPLDDTRLEAVFGYAAVCRFRGDWQLAGELLLAEPLPDTQAGVTYPSAALSTAAERLSLDFELGRMNDIADRAKTILSHALAAGEWPIIIAAHRQLGMIREERGDYSLARDHLDRACHYAEDLLDTTFLAERIPSYAARGALRADCLRELAAVEWRAGEIRLAKVHLDLAVQVLESIGSNPVADYLMNVIAYQRGRVLYSIDQDYESARHALRESYKALQKYDNPIRLATVLESLVQLEMDFIRGSDDATAMLRPTLEKVRRVRQMRGHDYMIARTTRNLGHLEFALGNYVEAKDRFSEARGEFNRLGKYPETAATLRALSRCLSRLGDSEGAVEMLDDALEQLHEPDHHAVLAEIRAERARLRHRRLAQSQIGGDTEMTEVGEFAVHDWIVRGLLRSGIDSPSVMLGVGDDCAVLRPGDDEDLVVTTDSVPPGILNSDAPEAATYAARFSIVATLSDVIAMGGEPTAILLNLHMRRATSASWARAFLQSAAEEAARYGAVVVGGDLRERVQKALTVSAVGRIRRGHAITRTGAKTGDQVALTLSSSPDHEFTGLGTRWALQLAPYLSRNEASLIRTLVDDQATYTALGLPLGVMRSIAQARLATSAIDTSDGLLACAELIGNACQVGIELYPEALHELINKDVAQLARSLDIAPFMFAFNAGYDWEVAVTVPAARRDELAALGEPRSQYGHPRVAVIGQVVEQGPWAEEGVRLRVPKGRPVILPFFTGEKFVPRPYLLRAREWLEFARESTRRMRPELSGMDIM